VLELPGVAMAAGLRAVQVLGLPYPIVAILQRKLAATRLTVQAALTGRRDLVVEAMLADGSVTDPDVARRLAGDLLDAQRGHIPRLLDD